jgi:hypothetical protein
MRLHIRGPLSRAALEEAAARLVREEESLRQVFFSDGAAPRLCDPGDIGFRFVDAASWTDDDVERLCKTEAAHAFEMNGAPLVRFTLVARSEDDHTLLFTWHQLVHDSARGGFLAAELMSRYLAIVAGASSGGRPSRPRYVDFAVWEREWFASEGRSLVEGTQERLRGAASIALRHELPPAPRESTKAVVFRLAVDGDAYARFTRLAREHGALAVATAAVALAVHTLVDLDDVVLLCPFSRRIPPELQSVAGRFGTWGAVRMKGRTPSELLASGRAAVGSLGNQSPPLPLVYETDDVFDHPLSRFSVNVTKREPPDVKAKQLPALHGLTVTDVPLFGEPSARTDLTLQLTANPTSLTGILIGRADLFDPARLESVGAAVDRALRSISR